MDALILKRVEFSYVATMSFDDLLDGELMVPFHVAEERIFCVYMHKFPALTYDGW
ncbi:hypothetical protein COCC4DRAFT_33187 [Bipolaris maydis ATCC 48331]|uniref:Uncharacterized protein n=2 Tax=Cochliobolus heterostrophus TaxID=5016 RepID=M2TJM1_COCH5|nr:uncharacterized protein COCC4DRAFT_33187 [Bipolaris maydis ATCC 48331]EMD86684.1 hypothetical protein COCHEDRAFT_1023895 [Bipolaris maydis C5]ENI03080.1 hypothetical protein COCC4DRAFT_33187 [Bipolaris maydis ATCC 48331]